MLKNIIGCKGTKKTGKRMKKEHKTGMYIAVLMICFVFVSSLCNRMIDKTGWINTSYKNKTQGAVGESPQRGKRFVSQRSWGRTTSPGQRGARRPAPDTPQRSQPPRPDPARKGPVRGEGEWGREYGQLLRLQEASVPPLPTGISVTLSSCTGTRSSVRVPHQYY